MSGAHLHRSDTLAAARRARAAIDLIEPLSATLRGSVAELDDGATADDCALRGWTRGHLITHVARNAEALSNLLTWARTGVETPAYPSDEARDADIEAGAHRPAAELLADLDTAIERYGVALREMPEQAWSTDVVDRQGTVIPAHQVPWMRVTELVVHSVDLRVGHDFRSMLATVGDAAVAELLDGVVATYSGRADVPAARVEVRLPGGTVAPWTIGAGVPVDLAGDAAAAVAWLTGRGAGDRLDGPVPALPHWR